MLKVIWVSISAFVSKWPITPKWQILGQNGFQIWDSGLLVDRIGGAFGLFDLVVFKVPLFNNGLQSKTAGHRMKHIEIWDSGVLLEHTLCTFEIKVFKVLFGVIQ